MSKLTKALTAAAGNAAGESLYVEDVFSTYLYTGTGSDRTVTNDIDLSGEGGLVWIKNRDRSTGTNHVVFDTERGTNKELHTNTTEAEDTAGSSLSAFNANGFDIDGFADNLNSSDSGANQYVSWTFRKAEKFFDVVTYTGTGSTQTLNHNINGSVGCIIMKRLDNGGSWYVWHKEFESLYAFPAYLRLDTTNSATGDGVDFITNVTSSSFDVGPGFSWNQSGASYVVYVFASDAGGFGDDDESIIKCGSYTGNGSTDGPVIDCGFEPQWLLIKNTSNGGNWVLMDAMRGMPVGDEATVLLPNASGAESSYANLWGVDLQANGFKVNVSQIQINESGGTMVYIAIRRPMKTPESGTEVFDTILRTGTGSNATITGMGFTPDLAITKLRTSDYPQWAARLTNNKYLKSSITDAETTGDLQLNAWDVQEGLKVYSGGFNSNGGAFANWFFRRATGFFDVACHTSDGVTESYPHNLGVTPELKIIKNRGDGTVNWVVGGSVLGAPTNRGYYLYLNTTASMDTNDTFFDQEDTASVYGVRSNNSSAGGISGNNYVVYLFATLAGVSKVGSYTGTGSDQNIDCGFSAGARFVLIKRTSGTGNWYVYDSARGIVASNDPYLLLNSTAAEVTSTDYIDPFSSGFAVTTAGDNSTNINGSNYIFLAIA